MAKKKTPANRAEDKAAAAQRRSARKEKSAAQAAAAEAARRTRQRKERMVTASIAAAVVALVAAVVWWNVRDTGPVLTPEGLSADHALVIGDADAPHEVQVYEDFLCPACANFEASSSTQLAAAAAEGRARVKYYPINFLSHLGDYSERATNAFAVVLDEAGPEVAKKFHDALFADQPAERGDKPDDEWLVEKAAEAGADEDAVRPGIEDEKFADWVEEATDAASKAGITQTPTIKVDGQRWENGDVNDLLGMVN